MAEEKTVGETAEAKARETNEFIRDGDPERPSAAERRIHARHASSITTEVIEPRSRTRLTGRATDLSIGGCYVDTMSPFPVRTMVHVRLTSENRSFQCKARVVYENAGMGMGLAFIELAPQQNAAIQAWVRELSGELPLEDDSADMLFGFEAPQPVPKATDLREVVAVMIKMLAKKNLLTRAEVDEFQKKLLS